MSTDNATSTRTTTRMLMLIGVALLASFALAPTTAGAQDDPYSECVTTSGLETGGTAERAQTDPYSTDPYSNCPPGTEPKLITQSSEPDEDRVLGTRILPFTGATLLGFLALGLAAIAVGVALARRRRRA